MATSKVGALVSVMVLALAMSSLNTAEAQNGTLSTDFYSQTCPQYEAIIYDYINKLYNSPVNNTVISMIRWAFHDFVNGADASFLLKASNFPSGTSEQDSDKQVGMRNSKYVNDIKLAVDAVCPGVISCADTLAVAGAASVTVMGGPNITIRVGRRDSRISLKESADKIPNPYASVDELEAFFAPLGLDLKEAVAMLAGHSVGRSHCVSFWDRLYPTTDPRLTPKFASKLYERCPRIQPTLDNPNPLNVTNPIRFTYIRNDPETPLTMDVHYYQEVLNRRGVMTVDDNLIWDNRTLPIVQLFAANETAWKETFKGAFQKLSEIKVLTGTEGEIRARCTVLNPVSTSGNP